jgi:hypothetical protein
MIDEWSVDENLGGTSRGLIGVIFRQLHVGTGEYQEDGWCPASGSNLTPPE